MLEINHFFKMNFVRPFPAFERETRVILVMVHINRFFLIFLSKSSIYLSYLFIYASSSSATVPEFVKSE